MEKVSLSQKFLKRVLIILLIGQALTMMVVYRDRMQVENNELTNRIRLLTKITANSAYRALLENDFTYMTLIINEMLNDQDIISIAVDSRKGPEIVYQGESPKKPASQESLVLPITSRDGDVGSVRISYTRDNIREKLIKHLITLIALQAFVVLALILLIRFFFRKDIGSKIIRVGTLLEEVKDGNLSSRINYDSDQDEIGAIANGLDFLIDHLAGTIIKMETISGNLRLAIDQTNMITSQVVNLTEEQQKNLKIVFDSLKEASLSQEQIIDHTAKLQNMAQANSDALTHINVTYGGIVHNIDSLDGNMASLNTSVDELSHSSKEVATRADEAAESVKDASMAMDSINISVTNINNVVKDTTAFSIESSEGITKKGIAVVSNVIETMERIESFFNSLSATVVRLDERSQDIKKIAMVIQEITTQINLLSLNALIIAGQAGESGKSFAVVANEMKLLATKTALSAKEIESIIHTIQNEINSAVSETRDTAQIVQDGNSAAAMTGEVLDEILDMSRRSTEMMQGIAALTGEQSQLSDSVRNDIRLLHELNHQVKNAAYEEEKSTTVIMNAVYLISSLTNETREATDKQFESLKIIAENTRISNTRVDEIIAASSMQQEINHAIIGSIAGSLEMGNSIITYVQEVSAGINDVHIKLERLRQEMKFFRTNKTD
jgi:methyl-accepting chemotaxis protein